MKTLSPQELIDLPGYGNAENHLRKSRRWVKTDAEKLSDRVDKLQGLADSIKWYADDIADELQEMT